MPDGLAQARLGHGRVVFLQADEDEELPWSEFFVEAEQCAAWLRHSRGIGPGSRVVILASRPREMVTAIAAIWMTGAALTCAPTPARGVDLVSYSQQTARRLETLGASLALVGEPYTALAAELRRVTRVDRLEEVLAAEPSGVWKAPDLVADDPAIYQFTSGTIARPKVVRISHGHLMANITAIRTRVPHDDRHGRMLSWLPMSHDMGLIGAVATYLVCGECDLIIGSTADYLTDPSGWMRNAARHRATALVAPASAYALAGRLLTTGPRLDLSSVRSAVCGGEPIDPTAIEAFLAAAAGHGFRKEAFLPAYGLAEATLIVASRRPGEGLAADEIDLAALASRHLALPAISGRASRRLARLGPPVPGTELRIVDPHSVDPRPPRAVGEIQVRGPSVASYLGAAAPAAVEKGEDDGMRTADGWLSTGDLGYLADDELVVCGRAKDLIIVGGRNVYPEEIEQAVERVAGIRAGNVVAFAARRAGGVTDGVAIAAEVRPGHDEATIRERVTAAIRAAVGLRPMDIHLLPPGSVPKTPSGKLRRSQAALLLGGEAP
jgi:fatty-acyl-CoA synthase